MSRVVSPAEHRVRTDFTVRLPGDGVELGATVLSPLADEPFPALVWCDPYRNCWNGGGGGVAEYLARRGYHFVYLHARGTGNSEGLSVDEYMAEETADSVAAIAWLADQPWCSGAVGMLGTSYSGFTAIQTAAEAPPALRAIAPAYFTDRRYTDDCHYKGGCLRGFYDTMGYGLNMVARNALPPHPEAVGGRWSELWAERLEGAEPYLLKWLQHPFEDDYWARGSVAGRYDRITAASLLIGGWYDGYPTPPLRTFSALSCPKRLLMGPWNHSYANSARSGPRSDVFAELCRWFDHYLKGLDNGVDREPAVQVYVPRFEPPILHRALIAGDWCCADSLPDEAETWHLGDGTLSDRPAEVDSAHRYEYRPAACRHGGIWDGGSPFALPADQRLDDLHAVHFTGPPLSADLTILGQPVVRMTVSADVPVLPLAVRLCEVADDGTSVLVTKGILNLTRHQGFDRAAALAPGMPVTVELPLEGIAWRFTAGHRLRLSVTGSDFPNVWPTPYAGHGTIHLGPDTLAELTLPLWTDAAPLPFSFEPVESLPEPTERMGWTVVWEPVEDRWTLRNAAGSEFSVSDADPAHAYTRCRAVVEANWPGTQIVSEATGGIVSDRRTFQLTLSLTVTVNGALHHQRGWSLSVDRELL